MSCGVLKESFLASSKVSWTMRGSVWVTNASAVTVSTMTFCSYRNLHRGKATYSMRSSSRSLAAIWSSTNSTTAASQPQLASYKTFVAKLKTKKTETIGTPMVALKSKPWHFRLTGTERRPVADNQRWSRISTCAISTSMPHYSVS